MGKNNSSDNWRFGGDTDLPVILLLYFWLTFDRFDLDEDRDDDWDDHHDRDDRHDNGRDNHHHNGRNNDRDDDPDMDDIREAVIKILRKRIQHML